MKLKQFEQFLRDNNAYDNYVNNLIEDATIETIASSFEYKYYLKAVFSWKSSKQGSIYWHLLHDKWTKHLEEATKHRVYEDFVKFLTDNDAYTNFMEQAFIDRIGRVKETLFKEKPRNWIDQFVNWCQSPQRFKYWDILNDKWRHVYDASKYEGI